LDVAEKATAALNWLLRDESSHLQMGDAMVVFWAIDEKASGAPPQSLGFSELMKKADSLQVREFLNGAWSVHPNIPDTTRFYAAVLSSPQSRITVRSWHTETLPKAVKYFREWLGSSLLPNRYGDDCPTSIMGLADCTVRKSKNSKPLPRTYSELFESALFGQPLPSRLYSAALERQSLELAKGCDKKTITEFEGRLCARTALIKLYLSKKGVTINMNNHIEQNDAAYLCGRLLAILDKIHIEAHRQSGGTNLSPANRSYAAASTTPALAFPQLCKLARYHLNKIGGGWAHRLENGYSAEDNNGIEFEGLKHICARLKKVAGCNFPRTLSLEEQGRFAIGFYYERCRQWPKGKGKDSEKNNTNETTEFDSDKQE
jgi:CRISPR-associated protein Csd1